MSEKEEGSFLLKLWRGISVDGRGVPASITAIGATILGSLWIAKQAGVEAVEMAGLVETALVVFVSTVCLLLMTRIGRK